MKLKKINNHKLLLKNVSQTVINKYTDCILKVPH